MQLKIVKKSSGSRWSQSNRLAKLGVSRQTISLLERDEYTPSIIALKISQIFNETVESVFRLEEDE